MLVNTVFLAQTTVAEATSHFVRGIIDKLQPGTSPIWASSHGLTMLVASDSGWIHKRWKQVNLKAGDLNLQIYNQNK